MAINQQNPSRAVAPPEGAVDTHVHVFDPARFSLAAQRRYTPGPARPDQLLDLHAALGISCAVLVQPSVYGTDNGCLLDGLRQYGPNRARGVAVLDLGNVSDAQLQDLHAHGVRGIRLNLEVRHMQDPQQAHAALEQAAAAVAGAGWHVQLHVAGSLLSAIEQAHARLTVPLVLDHFGGLKADDLAARPDRVDCLLRLLRTGRVFVKLSAFYRASSNAPHHADLAELIQRLAATKSDRLLWGSDWPHTGGGTQRNPAQVEPFRQVDLAASLAALRSWLPDAATWQQILQDNPRALYGFPACA